MAQSTFRALLLLRYLLRLVVAQSSPMTAMSMSSMSAMPMTTEMSSEYYSGAHMSSRTPQTKTVSVGYGGFKFTPNISYAVAGDTVVFQFFPSNHSVARAAYLSPCIPYEDSVDGGVGFWSGFRPISAEISDGPKWSLLINNTSPLFFYCSAPGSCTQQGMVGAINPESRADYERQRKAALNYPLELSPGELTPAQASASMSEVMASMSMSMKMASMTGMTKTSASSTITSAAAATTTAAAASSGGGGGSLSKGAIAGIAIGAAAVLLLAAAFFFFIGRISSLKATLAHRQSNAITPVPGNPDVIQVGGTVFVPVKVGDFHSRGGSQVLEVAPPYPNSNDGRGNAESGDNLGDLRSANASPRVGTGYADSDVSRRTSGVTAVSGGAQNVPRAENVNRPPNTGSPPPTGNASGMVSPYLGVVERQESRASRRGPHEMFAPLPGAEK